MKTKRILITTLAVIFVALDAHAGRWLSRDPIQEHMELDPVEQVQRGGPNPYAFVSNNPINFIDPFGLEKFDIWASAYIPDKYFIFPYLYDPAAIWSGDDRDKPQVRGSARAFHLVTIETDPNKKPTVSNISGGGVTTVRYLLNQTASIRDVAPSMATISRSDFNKKTIVSIAADTSDPLVSFAPSLHYNYELTFDACAGELKITGSHGRFPGFDLIVNDHTYVNYLPNGLYNTPAALFKFFGRESVDLPPVKIKKY